MDGFVRWEKRHGFAAMPFFFAVAAGRSPVSGDPDNEARYGPPSGQKRPQPKGGLRPLRMGCSRRTCGCAAPRSQGGRDGAKPGRPIGAGAWKPDAEDCPAALSGLCFCRRWSGAGACGRTECGAVFSVIYTRPKEACAGPRWAGARWLRPARNGWAA